MTGDSWDWMGVRYWERNWSRRAVGILMNDCSPHSSISITNNMFNALLNTQSSTHFPSPPIPPPGSQDSNVKRLYPSVFLTVVMLPPDWTCTRVPSGRGATKYVEGLFCSLMRVDFPLPNFSKSYCNITSHPYNIILFLLPFNAFLALFSLFLLTF